VRAEARKKKQAELAAKKNGFAAPANGHRNGSDKGADAGQKRRKS
jgi:hypothetical protein